MAIKLADLGFLEGIVAETIVSTYNIDGKPNAAPMGAIMQDEHHIIIKLFNSSQTCGNIKANKSAVINLSSDIEIYYKTAFKEVNAGELPEEWFGPAKSVNAPRLRLADAAIEVLATDMVPIGREKTKALFEVKQVYAAKKYPQIHCRAMSATIEAIIHATRVKLFINDQKQQANVVKLIGMINACNDVVDRTAPDSSYSMVMADLTKRIDSWRKR